MTVAKDDTVTLAGCKEAESGPTADGITLDKYFRVVRRCGAGTDDSANGDWTKADGSATKKN